MTFQFVGFAGVASMIASTTGTRQLWSTASVCAMSRPKRGAMKKSMLCQDNLHQISFPNVALRPVGSGPSKHQSWQEAFANRVRALKAVMGESTLWQENLHQISVSNVVLLEASWTSRAGRDLKPSFPERFSRPGHLEKPMGSTAKSTMDINVTGPQRPRPPVEYHTFPFARAQHDLPEFQNVGGHRSCTHGGI